MGSSAMSSRVTDSLPARRWSRGISSSRGSSCRIVTCSPSVRIGSLVEVIGRHLDLPVTALSPEEAQGHFGLFALFASMDAPASAWTFAYRFRLASVSDLRPVVRWRLTSAALAGRRRGSR
jgi:hypothetical protein